ncbi:hypothetical protein ACHAQK_003787 [Fusarium lateritium]
MEHLAGNTLSDMTIKCQERVYYANRAVVCPKSSFFDRAMNGYFKVGVTESTTGTIELPDDDPEILEYFLEFLYTGDYTDGVTKCGPCRVHLEELEEALAGWYTTSDDDTSSDSQESDEANGTDDDANSHQVDSDKEQSDKKDSDKKDSDEETDWDWDRPYTPETIEDLTMWYEEFFDDDFNKYIALPKTHGSDSYVAMTLPLRLYVMAVKYDVVPLADLARKRFIAAFVKHTGAYKANVVDELYQNTTSTADYLIREAVIKSLVDELYEFKGRFFIFWAVMLKHGDFAAELMRGFFFTLRPETSCILVRLPRGKYPHFQLMLSNPVTPISIIRCEQQFFEPSNSKSTWDPMAQNRASESEMPQAPHNGIRTPSSTGSRYRDDDHSDIDDFCGTSIHAAMSTLLGNDKFSDMTIICGGREFKAHRAVVCTQSSFFDKAMSSNFKEATSRVVELPEDDPDVVEHFLEFLYTGTYSDGVNSTWGKPSNAAMLDPKTVQRNLQAPAGIGQYTPESEQGESTEEIGHAIDPDYEYPEEEEKEPEEEYNEFDDNYDDENLGDDEEERAKVMNDISLLSKTDAMQQLADLRNDMTLPLRLYVMADKYDVPALRLLARDRFYRSVELVWEEADCFPDIVDELYQTTPPTDTAMREIVCRLVGTMILDMTVREKMRPVMAKHGDFAVGVMEYAIHLRNLWYM